jgi:uncharacterized protein YkwD
MTTLIRLCTAFLLVLCAGLAGTAASSPAYALEGCTVAGAETSLDPVESAMFAAINDYRGSLGLPRLEPSTALRREALWKAAARANGAAETHDDPDRGWSERFTACGYRDDAAMGENLAVFDGDLSPAEEPRRVLEAWQSSPDHERVQTYPAFRVVGLARVRVPGTFRTYWTVAYGSKAE